MLIQFERFFIMLFYSNYMFRRTRDQLYALNDGEDYPGESEKRDLILEYLEQLKCIGVKFLYWVEASRERADILRSL